MWIIKKLGGMDWIELAQNGAQWKALVNSNELLGYTKWWVILE
jgi:hypothetical protein